MLGDRFVSRSSDSGKQRPASGYRHATSGALTNVGSEGDSWSASPNAEDSDNAGNLNFNSGNVNPLNNTNRSNGLPVRCARGFTLLENEFSADGSSFGVLLGDRFVSLFSDSGKQRPASGLRNSTSGALDNVGTNGYSWSASPYAASGSNADYAGNLNFNSSNVNPLNNSNRSNGRPVRCARGFTPAWKENF